MILSIFGRRAVSRPTKSESVALVARRSQGVITLHRPDTPKKALVPLRLAATLISSSDRDLSDALAHLSDAALRRIADFAMCAVAERDLADGAMRAMSREALAAFEVAA